MAFDFKKLLSDEARSRHERMDAIYAEKTASVRALTDENLAATIKYYMANMRTPYRYDIDCPVYDGQFFHVLLPELLRRLKLNEKED